MGGRVAEGARLESVLWLKSYEGSNPSSSAKNQNLFSIFKELNCKLESSSESEITENNEYATN